MWTVDDSDFEALETWGLTKNPFAAVDDYSDLKTELRWLNKESRDAFVKYIHRRADHIGSKNFDNYYKTAIKPIERPQWEFLKHRKAWFIMPLGWDNFAKHSCRIADFGCGDGDAVQRIIDMIVSDWQKNGITDRKVEIVGLDLNASRIDNAKRHVTCNHPNISVEFKVADVVGGGIDYPDAHFDYCLCNGVLEVLEDEPCFRFMSEMCRTTARGLFIEDLYERFPGGYPRENLPELLKERGFDTKKKHVIMSEPFDVDRSRDPKKLFPIWLVLNLWAER